VNHHPSQPRRRRLNASPSPKFIPNDLIFGVFSLLPVKSVMRMRCLSKYSNSLITSPIFVKFYFQRFAQNPHLALVTTKTNTVVPFLVRDLLDNRRVTLTNDPHCLINDRSKDLLIHQIVGSINGLICFLSYLVPLHLSEDGDTFILASSLEDQAIIYNKRNNRVERTRITNSICWFSVKDYVESLASTCW